MARVLLLAKDWKARTMLRAQLIEEGFEVEACETVSEALQAANRPELRPDLLVADLTASANPATEVQQLAVRAKQIPIWLITTRVTTIDVNLQDCGFEKVMFRPIDLGQVVLQIKARLGM